MEWLDHTKLGSDGSDFRNIVYSQAINRSCSCRLADILTSSEKKNCKFVIDFYPLNFVLSSPFSWIFYQKPFFVLPPVLVHNYWLLFLTGGKEERES